MLFFVAQMTFFGVPNKFFGVQEKSFEHTFAASLPPFGLSFAALRC